MLSFQPVHHFEICNTNITHFQAHIIIKLKFDLSIWFYKWYHPSYTAEAHQEAQEEGDREAAFPCSKLEAREAGANLFQTGGKGGWS